jgi:Ribosomal protein S27.
MIGKGKKIRAKCPACGAHYTVSVEPSTLIQNWQVYVCSKCGIKFRLPKGWKKQVIQNRGEVRA